MIRATRKRLILDAQSLQGVRVIDVRVDGHRVWSTDVPESASDRVEFLWPPALKSRLAGIATVSITDAATGEILAEQKNVRFGWSRQRLELTDARGRWLAMTKWDRLGPVLEGRSATTGKALLDNGRALVDLLVAKGFDLYMVGGTLLGIVRDGALLPHDDDLDFAFLCPADNPLDLGLVSYDMERTLLAHGYTVVRHSLAHLEIEFFDDEGQPDHYIDIFTGFFRDGLYCQPFALRGPEVVQEDLLPTRPREVQGVELPEPANPSAWLEYAYGKDWRHPDPTFKFITPKATKNRFETWFGVFNRGRVYWDKHYLEYTEPVGVGSGEQAVERFLRDVPAGARILDLGCGDGRWTAALASRGNRVTGVDYSHEALRVARSTVRDGNPDFRYLNFNDRAALLEFGAWMLGTGDEWFIFAHHSVQSLTKTNRQNIYLLLDLVLRGRGFADIHSDIDLSRRYVHGQPSTWHLPSEWLEKELRGHPLRRELVHRTRRRDHRQLRRVNVERIRRIEGTVRAGDTVFARELAALDKKETIA